MGHALDTLIFGTRTLVDGDGDAVDIDRSRAKFVGATITDDPDTETSIVDLSGLAEGLADDALAARNLLATAPIKVNGTTTADLGSDVTISITAADSSNPGSQSAAHFNDVSNATSAATNNVIAKRDGSGGCGFVTVTTTLDTVGTGDIASVSLLNTTAATSGNQKHSPGIQFRGQQYWTGGPASTRVDMIVKIRPVESANLGESEFVIGYSSGGGSFTDLFVYNTENGPYFNKSLSGFTFTQTYSTATATVTTPSTVAYTGIDNLQVGTVYATVADLNTLRAELVTAYQLINKLIDAFQASGLSQ